MLCFACHMTTTAAQPTEIEIKRFRLQQLLDAAWTAPDNFTQQAFIAEATEIAAELKAVQS